MGGLRVAVMLLVLAGCASQPSVVAVKPDAMGGALGSALGAAGPLAPTSGLEAGIQSGIAEGLAK